MNRAYIWSIPPYIRSIRDKYLVIPLDIHSIYDKYVVIPLDIRFIHEKYVFIPLDICSCISRGITTYLSCIEYILEE
jgi:hypothetical protein